MPIEDPLDFIDFADVVQHGDPTNWRFKGPKPGSPVPATSLHAAPGTTKHYDLYDDEFGDEIEVHYFRNADGSLDDVKVKA
jgi:hypothetical protein